jgi:hypothetical protein
MGISATCGLDILDASRRSVFTVNVGEPQW